MSPVAKSTELERNERRRVSGTVISNKMDKTITVNAERLVKHPRYKKYVRRFTKLYAHDEKKEATVGDFVELVSTRPLSRTKRWRLLRIVRKSQHSGAGRLAPEKVLESLKEGALS